MAPQCCGGRPVAGHLCGKTARSEPAVRGLAALDAFLHLGARESASPIGWHQSKKVIYGKRSSMCARAERRRSW